MPAKRLVLLALDPGSREFGFAILVNGELGYFGVKTIKSTEHASAIAKEITRVLTTLIERYEPQVLAIKAADQLQRNTALLHLAAVTHETHCAKAGISGV